MLAIDEAAFGPSYPTVAIHSKNLAALMRDTNRLAEAKPLMRRHLAIFIEFERRTGHPHRHRSQGLASCNRLLAQMGKSEAEIEAAAWWQRAVLETRTNRTVFSDLFVVPAKAAIQEKVVKSADLDAGFAGMTMRWEVGERDGATNSAADMANTRVDMLNTVDTGVPWSAG